LPARLALAPAPVVLPALLAPMLVMLSALMLILVLVLGGIMPMRLRSWLLLPMLLMLMPPLAAG
jgi:hypothetical protein